MKIRNLLVLALCLTGSIAFAARLAMRMFTGQDAMLPS